MEEEEGKGSLGVEGVVQKLVCREEKAQQTQSQSTDITDCQMLLGVLPHK